MSTVQQAVENVRLFSDPDPTTEEEKDLLQRAVAVIGDLVPCTACRYCCDVCPQELDIPKLLSIYNETKLGSASNLRSRIDALAETELPSACLACGDCKALCPQGIDIPAVMEKFAETISNMSG